MKFTYALASTLAAVASAAPTSEPAPSENIDISDFFVRKYVTSDDTRIDVAGFKLTGKDAQNLDCVVQSPVFPNPTEVTTCGDSKYRFSLHPGTDGTEFSLRIYHELGTAVGFWGQGNIPSYCHAGGNGPGDFACTQVAPTTIVIDGDGPPVNP